MLGIEEKDVARSAGTKLYACYVVGLIESGRYGSRKIDKGRALKSTAKELGVNVDTLLDFAKQAE